MGASRIKEADQNRADGALRCEALSDIDLDEVIETGRDILKGKVLGRTMVDIE
jgi:hypothetical protein